MAKTRHKRHIPSAVSNRQRRKALRRSQVRIKRETLEVRRAVSLRGRDHPMETPTLGQPQQPQTLLMASTAIKRFKYWISQRRLRVWFVGGGVYEYYDVPESVFITLAQAQSKGRTFNRIIQEWIGTKPHKKLIVNYDYKKIR